ncbi:hypothetical protein PG996_011084 [Apiospora saccharicola]|uniref:Uncharacterized protein n=1 Tax=Apiospora saccharicola TaxID=335842 RepID=A0ABR1UE16_9PEZI
MNRSWTTNPGSRTSGNGSTGSRPTATAPPLRVDPTSATGLTPRTFRTYTTTAAAGNHVVMLSPANQYLYPQKLYDTASRRHGAPLSTALLRIETGTGLLLEVPFFFLLTLTNKATETDSLTQGGHCASLSLARRRKCMMRPLRLLDNMPKTKAVVATGREKNSPMAAFHEAGRKLVVGSAAFALGHLARGLGPLQPAMCGSLDIPELVKCSHDGCFKSQTWLLSP